MIVRRVPADDRFPPEYWDSSGERWHGGVLRFEPFLPRGYRCPAGDDGPSWRLDSIAKRAAAGMSRRGVLRAVLGVLAGAVLASVAGCTKPIKRDFSSVCPQCGTCADCNIDTSAQTLVCTSCAMSCDANTACTKAYSNNPFLVLFGYLKNHGYVQDPDVNLYQTSAAATPSGASTPAQDPSKGEADIVRFRVNGVVQFTAWAVRFVANGGAQRAVLHFLERPTGTSLAVAFIADTTFAPEAPVGLYYSLYVRDDLTVVRVGPGGVTYARHGSTHAPAGRPWSGAKLLASPTSDPVCLTTCEKLCQWGVFSLLFCGLAPAAICAYLVNPAAAATCMQAAMELYAPVCNAEVSSKCDVYCTNSCSCTGCLACQKCSGWLCTDDCGACATCTTAGCVKKTCSDGQFCGPDGLCRCPIGRELCGDECADLTNDRFNCGICGVECDPYVFNGRMCIQGQCTCDTGETLCGTECTVLKADSDNCGACGNTCSMQEDCSSGRCVSIHCVPNMPNICCENGILKHTCGPGDTCYRTSSSSWLGYCCAANPGGIPCP
jgi:hypothetical protein